MYRIGFILEQALGHITHAQNLMANVPKDPEIEPYWGLVPWETRGLAARLPLYRSNWTLRAGLRAGRLAGEMVRRATRRERAHPFGRCLAGRTVLPHAGARRAGCPLVEAHSQRGLARCNTDPVRSSSANFTAMQRVLRALEHYKWRLNRDCFRAARHIVTWANWTKRGLIDDYEVPADKITVIPPGVNVREWRRPVPRTAHDGPVKILFVGGNLERKGGLVLLDAFRRLAAEARSPTLHGPLELHLVTRDRAAPGARCLRLQRCWPQQRPAQAALSTTATSSACPPAATVCPWS